ncbi:acyl-CoA carboxylase subunit epsilon [Streptomyces sp. NPDC046197]|uniref:acyl-CoA carboxylase subunit epsilon n=1 Tax=Streptomyces sp. NPDC046197 TaxID=3154337 RepID=UPI0033C35BA6
MADTTHITVVRGQPDETELAAVTAVLLALARRRDAPDEDERTAFAGWTVKGGGYHTPVAWSGP